MSPRGVVPVGRGPVYPHGTAEDAEASRAEASRQRLAVIHTATAEVSRVDRIIDHCPPWLAARIVADVLTPLLTNSLYQGPESDPARQLKEASVWLGLPMVEAPDAVRQDDG